MLSVEDQQLLDKALELCKIKYDSVSINKKVGVNDLVHYVTNLIEITNSLYGNPDRTGRFLTKLEILEILDSIFSTDAIVIHNFAFEKLILLEDVRTQARDYLALLEDCNFDSPWLRYNIFAYNTPVNHSRDIILDITVNKAIQKIIDDNYNRYLNIAQQKQRKIDPEAVLPDSYYHLIATNKIKSKLQQDLDLDVQIILRECFKKSVKNIDTRFLALITYLNGLIALYAVIFSKPEDRDYVVTEFGILYLISAFVLSDIFSYAAKNTFWHRSWDHLSLALIFIFGCLIGKPWVLLDEHLGCRAFKATLIALLVTFTHGIKTLTPLHMKVFSKDRFYVDKGFRFLRTQLISARNFKAAGLPSFLLAIDAVLSACGYDLIPKDSVVSNTVTSTNTQSITVTSTPTVTISNKVTISPNPIQNNVVNNTLISQQSSEAICFDSAADFFKPTRFFVAWIIASTLLIGSQIIYFYFMLPKYAKRTEAAMGLQKWFPWLPFSLTLNKLFKSRHAENIRAASGVIFTARIYNNLLSVMKGASTGALLTVHILGAFIIGFIGPLLGSLLQVTLVSRLETQRSINSRYLSNLLSEANPRAMTINGQAKIIELLNRQKVNPQSNFEKIQIAELSVPGPIEYGYMNIKNAISFIGFNFLLMHYYDRAIGNDLSPGVKLGVDFVVNTLVWIFIVFLQFGIGRADFTQTIDIEATAVPSRIYNFCAGLCLAVLFCDWSRFKDRWDNKVWTNVLVKDRPPYHQELTKQAKAITSSPSIQTTVLPLYDNFVSTVNPGMVVRHVDIQPSNGIFVTLDPML